MRAELLFIHLVAILLPPSQTTIIPSEEVLVTDECAEEYDLLQIEEPIKADKVLHVKHADAVFDGEAENLQVPGYDPVAGRGLYKRTRNSKKLVRRNAIHRRHDVTFTYEDYQRTRPTASTVSPEQYFNRVERTELLYRVTKGIKEMNLCELETFYVRRYNKFPFFVKSVTCQKNKGISGQIICKSRYEKGHILRLDDIKQCYQGDQENNWIHDWETRVVGCDAVLPVSEY